MATDADLFSLYGKLRDTLLTRHFAVGRYFRANHLSLANHLGSLHSPGSLTSPDWDDHNLGCDRDIVRPTTYTSAGDLLGKQAGAQLIERWRVGDHERENPLMRAGLLLICLAVEHHLGRQGAALIIREALTTIGSLYKFGDTCSGYPIRWDPVTSDHWVTRRDGPNTRLQYCCDFLLSSSRDAYLYCTPFQDPRYTGLMRTEDFKQLGHSEKQAYTAARWKSLDRYRRWEPSMDELVGLIMGYDIVYRLVDEQAIRDEVRRQVNDLGTYLAEHGYLLVRPLGGFSARGASGVLPALGFPWGRVFERITGTPYESRASFKEACQKAGVWQSLSARMFWYTFLSMPIALIFATLPLAFLGTKLGGISASLGIAAVMLTISGVLARAYAVYQSGECFDVWGWPGDGTSDFPANTYAQDEFATAYILKALAPSFSFQWMMRIFRDHGTSWAARFPPLIGLTGLDDQDERVAKAFLAFLPERRMHSELDADYPEIQKYTVDPFSSAVAVVLGAGEDEERNLVSLLDRWHGELANTAREDWTIVDDVNGTVSEAYEPALPFMAALALSWLHARRRADAGNPVPPGVGFPSPPTAADKFPEPTIPDAVVKSGVVLPADTWAGGELAPTDLFADGNSKQEEPPPPALKPSAQKTLAVDRTVIVREADWGVDTGVVLQDEDEYLIEATGEIWAGVWFTSTNGPEGWNYIDWDLKFPVHGPPNGYPFALIGRLGGNGYFYVGKRYPAAPQPGLWGQLHLGASQRLWLRTNDDTPGNGMFEFTCRIRVWR
jgi:hypothetical protein